MLGEIALLDKGPGPDRPYECLLIDHVSVVIEQHQQGIECLGRQRDDVSVPQQHRDRSVQTKGTEFIKALLFQWTSHHKSSLKKNSALSQDFRTRDPLGFRGVTQALAESDGPVRNIGNGLYQ